MNNDLAETEMFLVELKKQVFPENVVVMIAPPFTSLNHAFNSVVSIGNGCCPEYAPKQRWRFYWRNLAKMLKSVGANTVILIQRAPCLF